MPNPNDSPRHHLVCDHCHRIHYYQYQQDADEAELAPTWNCPYCGQSGSTWQRETLSDIQTKVAYCQQEIERRQKEITKLEKVIAFYQKAEALK